MRYSLFGLMNPYASILVSRQSLAPCRRTPWVESMLKAVAWLKARGCGVISSLGYPTWDLISVATAEADLPLRLVLSSRFRREWRDDMALLKAYGLSAERTEILAQSEQSESVTCDDAIIPQADLLLPISLRTRGSLERLITVSSKPIEGQFRIPYSTRNQELSYRVNTEQTNAELERLAPEFFFHWTRTCYHHWPDESPAQYCRAVLASDTYPRSALRTLRHILETGIVRPSGRHMPSGTPCVSLSAAQPNQVVQLMRWRARYRQMSLEPYGLGVRRSVATKLGIRPVEYVEGSTVKRGLSQQWYQQTIGTRGDWPPEQEHRLIGPLDLCLVSPADFLIVCRFESEIDQLPKTGIPTIWFEQTTRAT